MEDQKEDRSDVEPRARWARPRVRAIASGETEGKGPVFPNELTEGTVSVAPS